MMAGLPGSKQEQREHSHRQTRAMLPRGASSWQTNAVTHHHSLSVEQRSSL
jgi:hypothetical protein